MDLIVTDKEVVHCPPPPPVSVPRPSEGKELGNH
jgi:hypothetical protein